MTSIIIITKKIRRFLFHMFLRRIIHKILGFQVFNRRRKSRFCLILLLNRIKLTLFLSFLNLKSIRMFFSIRTTTKTRILFYILQLFDRLKYFSFIFFLGLDSINNTQFYFVFFQP